MNQWAGGWESEVTCLEDGHDLVAKEVVRKKAACKRKTSNNFKQTRAGSLLQWNFTKTGMQQTVGSEQQSRSTANPSACCGSGRHQKVQTTSNSSDFQTTSNNLVSYSNANQTSSINHCPNQTRNPCLNRCCQLKPRNYPLLQAGLLQCGVGADVWPGARILRRAGVVVDVRVAAARERSVPLSETRSLRLRLRPTRRQSYQSDIIHHGFGVGDAVPLDAQ